MKTVKIPIKEGERLQNALNNAGYKNIPENAILDKTLTGIGATYIEITAKRNSIIIEPNVPVIIGKKVTHPEILAVHENCKPKQIEEYLRSETPKHKKILVTPEGFTKIRKAAKNIKVDIYKQYFCLFDECEKITQDIGYRNTISQPIYDFFQFKKKAFVSATPLEIRHPMLEEQGFVRYEIEPDFDYRKKIHLVVTTEFLDIVNAKLKSLIDSSCICIFYNSVTGINKIITSLGIETESKVFCSEEFANDLRKKDFSGAATEIKLPLARYNFFTCRFYSAVDIEMDTLPDVIMLTNINEAEHSMIDPLTESIQIQGRFRKGFNSLTHITTVKPELIVRTTAQIDKEIEEYKITHEGLMKRLQEADLESEAAIKKDMDKVSYKDYLDEQGEFNFFSVDNRYNNERVRDYYRAEDQFYEAYTATGHFIRDEENMPTFGIYYLAERIKRAPSFRAIVSLIVDVVRGMSADGIECYRKSIVPLYGDSDFIINAYILLGERILKKSKKDVGILYDKEVAKITKGNLLISKPVLIAIQKEFSMDFGEKIPANVVKSRLESVFRDCNITDKVSQTTVKKYFTSTHNKGKEPYYILSGLLPAHLIVIDGRV